VLEKYEEFVKNKEVAPDQIEKFVQSIRAKINSIISK